MINIIIDKNIYLLIEVPNDAHNFKPEFEYRQDFHRTISYECKTEYYDIYGDKKIKHSHIGVNSGYPTEMIEIYGSTNNITEEQACSIVEKAVQGGLYYKSYDKQDIALLTAKESLQSLIEHHGLDNNKNYLIIRKNDRNQNK